MAKQNADSGRFNAASVIGDRQRLPECKRTRFASERGTNPTFGGRWAARPRSQKTRAKRLQFQRDDAGFYAKAAIVRRSCAEISRFAIKIPFIAAYEAAAHPGLCRSKHSAHIFRNLRFRFNVQLGKGSYHPSERAPCQAPATRISFLRGPSRLRVRHWPS